MASFGTWLTAATLALWAGTLSALATGFWANLELIGVLAVLAAAVGVIGVALHSRALAVAGLVGLFIVAGLGVATAFAPSVPCI